MSYTTVLTIKNDFTDPELIPSNIKQEIIIYYIKKRGISLLEVAKMSTTGLLPSEIHGILVSLNPNQILLNKLYRDIIPADTNISINTDITIKSKTPFTQ